MNKEEIVLKVDDLKISINHDEGELTPVRGISFEIKKGETLGLVGESGCGKSLTSKTIIGINGKNMNVSGSIKYNNGKKELDLLNYARDSKELRKIRGNDITMIFQEPMSAFSPLFKVGKQIQEAVRLHVEKDKKKSKQMAIEAMTKVGISNPEKRYEQYPHEFSGGMLQRALIAMALVTCPKLLIADEPTTALDVTIQAQIMELMKNLQNEYNMGILYITHDLGTVAKMCDKVAVMYLGKIVEYGDVRSIFNRPTHPYTKGLMSSVHKIGNKNERLFAIEGTVPVAMNLKDRCSFYYRCTNKNYKCDSVDPQLKEFEPNHYCACYNYKEV